MRYNFRKDKDEIESDVKTMIDDRKEMEMINDANEGKGLDAVIEKKVEKGAEVVVELEIDEQKLT